MAYNKKCRRLNGSDNGGGLDKSTVAPLSKLWLNGSCLVAALRLDGKPPTGAPGGSGFAVGDVAAALSRAAEAGG